MLDYISSFLERLCIANYYVRLNSHTSSAPMHPQMTLRGKCYSFALILQINFQYFSPVRLDLNFKISE